MPCILHWKQEHFVVLYRVKKNCFHIADPALGLIKLSKDEFEQCWVEIYESGTPKGIALFLEPKPYRSGVDNVLREVLWQ
jgi:ATP-binding cassette subfamily B protein